VVLSLKQNEINACQWKETPALWTHLEVCAGQEIQKKSSSRDLR